MKTENSIAEYDVLVSESLFGKDVR